jgi:hypothetical protein
MKSRKVRQVEHVARVAQDINAYKILIRKLKERGNLEDFVADGNTISKRFLK